MLLAAWNRKPIAFALCFLAASTLCFSTDAQQPGNPSWRSMYQWSRHLAEVAHEHLRAGELDNALAVLFGGPRSWFPLRWLPSVSVSRW